MAGPTTGIIDSFTRADQDPIASGWLGPVVSGDGQMKIVSSQAVPGASVSNESYWNTPFSGDHEAYLTIPVLTTSASGHGLAVMVGIKSPGVGGVTYYQFYYETSVPGTMQIYNQAGTPQASGVSFTLSANDKIWLRWAGTSLQGGYFTSGAWNTPAGLAATVSATSGSYYLGMFANADALTALDDFGGGSLVTIVSSAVLLPMSVSSQLRT